MSGIIIIVTLSAKNSLMLEEFKAGFCRDHFVNQYSYKLCGNSGSGS